MLIPHCGHFGYAHGTPRGTSVISTTRGIESRVGENSLGGTVVWVLGPAGDRHYHAHLDSVADIRSGQRVVPGDVLAPSALPAMRARGTPPHLHYGI
ncbi:MAG: M23 family metallopeptidase [Burkholderiaceae bacterium]